MQENDASVRMPAVFFGHGSPMATLEDNLWTRAWRAFGEEIRRPRAVLMVSAHWTTRGLAVTAMERPRTLHDFGGFPQPLYEIQYPAPGAPWLAERVRDLLSPVDVAMDLQWGLDHGSWTVLRHAWPAADIPVVQLSLDLTQPASWHLQQSRRLAVLRDEGVLIAGSGNIVHNLREMLGGDPDRPLFAWARRFEAWVRERALAHDTEALTNPAAQGPDAGLAVPTPEHYLPLIYVMAQCRAGDRIRFPVEGGLMGSISMLEVRVG